MAALLWLVSVPVSAAPDRVRIAAVAEAHRGSLNYTGTPAVVMNQGWLAAELQRRGIELEWVPVTVGGVAAQVNEAFARGRVDLAIYGDLPSIILNAQGVETRLLMPGTSISNTYLVVPANSEAQSIADLKGRRVVLHRARPWEYAAARLIESHGLSFSDFRLLNLNPAAGSAALTTGSADALFVSAEGFLLVDKGVGRIIWDSKQPPEDWKWRSELWGIRGFVETHPEIIDVVVEAFVRAKHWISDPDNFDAYVDIVRRPGQPESVIRREFEGEHEDWRERWSPRFSPTVLAHFAGMERYAREARLTRQPLDVETLYRPEHVERALRRLELESYWPEQDADVGEAAP